LSEIEYAYPLLRNKVTSPHYVTPTLRRARLIEWLNEVSSCRALVVAADAGYGKTTLLWQWEREVEFPCYWYKLDRNDRDWSLHISYLIEAVRQRHPEFGRRAHSMLEQLGGPGSSRPGVAAYLLAEMHERLSEPCTFIIDDWQFVASVTEVRGLWNQILRDAPPTCRFVFLSRAKPQLQFARFKTHGGYAEMRTDALRFNDREIEELFRDIYRDPLDSTELAELERRTEGWAASLQLVEVSLRERQSPEDRRAFIESITATRDSDLVEFLAEEVLEQQPQQVREFLLATSVLQRITPELAARLTGVSDGNRLLVGLEERGLFTYRLDPHEHSYRYHGLFRDFLERRLLAERSAGEVAALHIHAASYFETSHSWPEAIHHYLRAGLQPQAARLIAKYGEDLASTGRLPLLDGWIRELPSRAVSENARLSLLLGETSCVRGEWKVALAALERAKGFFSRKGDRRMEAVACSKLSTVYSNLGDVDRSAALAQEGLLLASDDDHRTRIRLRGNLAVTTTWLESLDRAVHECTRVAVESSSTGLEQYAAIAHHNLGVMLRYAGRLEESATYLERAAKYWDASPANPFADNSEFVQVLLMQGDVGRASAMAESAVTRTKFWSKPLAEATYGAAWVLLYRGRFADAIQSLRSLLIEHRPNLGSALQKITSLLIECLYLDGSGSEEMGDLLADLAAQPKDPRLAPISEVALALAAHRVGACDGHCERAQAVLARWRDNGSALISLLGSIPVGLLAMEHGSSSTALRHLAVTVIEVVDVGAGRYMRWWLRRISPHAPAMLKATRDPAFLIALLNSDPEHWVPTAAGLLSGLKDDHRKRVLTAIEHSADPSTQVVLGGVDGADVQELRRRLVNRFAEPIYIRTFGQMLLHTGSWSSPGRIVPKKRMRLLLSLLAASYESGLTREQVLDLLWPDSHPAAAVNSLNQTVFQLRRLIDGGYREGDSPQYIHSTADVVQLNPNLVKTDHAEFLEVGRVFRHPTDQTTRATLAESLVDFIRGEYLSDVRYEDWASSAQLRVHTAVRQQLLPIALGDYPGLSAEVELRAGHALTDLDPYDEQAHLAIAKALAGSGRRTQARAVLNRFSERVKADLDEDPSEEIRLAASLVGADLGSSSV
jgi:ATP/maltotriose-dependent transcriptional regulator MalT/DNA-binding SARP family transcriptional activator